MKLAEPFALGRLRLPNRLVMAPMTRSRSPHGVPGSDVAAYYRRRVEGGVGLIITEGTWIDHPAASNEDNAPNFHGDEALAGWRQVVAQVHGAGGFIMPQLWHTGLTRRPQTRHLYDVIEEDFARKVSPSGYVMPGEKLGEPMSEAVIAEVIAAFAKAARTAEALGFDGIELHGAHGYLIDQFLWQETNHRQDDWGGDIARRSRFAAQVVRACRAAVSADFPIIFRFSQWKLQDYDARIAHTPAELEAILAPIAEAGVDVFHASQRRYWDAEFPGSSLNLAGWAKKLTGKPTITVGSVGLATEVRDSMTEQDFAATTIDPAEQMVARGEVDLVAVGRALLSDARWSEKMLRGAIGEVKPYNSSVLATLD